MLDSYFINGNQCLGRWVGSLNYVEFEFVLFLFYIQLHQNLATSYRESVIETICYRMSVMLVSVLLNGGVCGEWGSVLVQLLIISWQYVYTLWQLSIYYR